MDEPTQRLAADDQTPRNAGGLGAGDYAAGLIGRPLQELFRMNARLVISSRVV